MPTQQRPADDGARQRLLRESRMQAAAALMLGALVLLIVILRAVSHSVLPPGWWHRW